MTYLPVMNRLGQLALEAFPRPVSGLVIVDGLGRVAMAYQEYANQGWCFPKGGVDHRETTVEAAIREAREEIGLEVELLPDSSLGFLGKVFHENLGFGSPRGSKSMIHKPTCLYFGAKHEVTHAEPPGETISQAAYDLISAAWRDHHGFDPSESEVLAMFDMGKHHMVRWIQSPTYYFASFRSHIPEAMTGETDEAAWLEPAEMIRRAEEGALTLPRKLHGDVARIVRSSEFLPAVSRAASGAAISDRPTRA